MGMTSSKVSKRKVNKKQESWMNGYDEGRMCKKRG